MRENVTCDAAVPAREGANPPYKRSHPSCFTTFQYKKKKSELKLKKKKKKKKNKEKKKKKKKKKKLSLKAAAKSFDPEPGTCVRWFQASSSPS